MTETSSKNQSAMFECFECSMTKYHPLLSPKCILESFLFECGLLVRVVCLVVVADSVAVTW